MTPAIDAPLLNWDELRRMESSWAYLGVSHEEDVDNFTPRGQVDKDTVVTFIRGGRCVTPDSLFHEFAAAFQFPYYFGNNWSALNDCLSGDLDWFRASTYVCLITRIESVLARHSDDFRILIGIFKDASAWWASGEYYTPALNEPAPPKVRFCVVFHCETHSFETAVDRLRVAGVDPPVRAVPDNWRQKMVERDEELEVQRRQRIRRFLKLPPEPE